MTKKLSLSEFLADPPKPLPPTSVRKEESEMLTFPLTEFCNTITAFDGQFCINDRLYSSVLPSTNSLYFFNEANEDDYMLIFDPIIDIKQRSSAFIVFYYPNHVINVSLKEAHVTKEPFEKDSKG